MRFSRLFLGLAIAALTVTPSFADIEFFDGEGDLTIYYQSQTDTWFSVFLDKGETVFTGGTIFPGYPGIVGWNEAGIDLNFDDTLTVNLNTNVTLDWNSETYFVSSAEGSPIFDEGTADLGLRLNLAENLTSFDPEDNVLQFDEFQLTLDLDASTFNGTPLSDPGSPEVLIADGVDNDPIVVAPLIETADGDLTANFFGDDTFEHEHYHWGFSELGEYTLAFDLVGVGGLHGITAADGSGASVGSVSINYSVVPEPVTAGLLLFGVGCLLLGARRSSA